MQMLPKLIQFPDPFILTKLTPSGNKGALRRVPSKWDSYLIAIPKLAIQYYRDALEVLKPDSLPHDCREATYGLGRLLYDEGRFDEARDAFVMLHEAVDFMRGEAIRVDTRERLAEENAEIYARLVYCCMAVGDEASAFKYATAGKGRAFVDLLSSAQIDLSNVPDKALQEKVAQARELKARLDGLIGPLLGEATSMNTQRSQQEAISELSEAQRKALLSLWAVNDAQSLGLKIK